MQEDDTSIILVTLLEEVQFPDCWNMKGWTDSMEEGEDRFHGNQGVSNGFLLRGVSRCLMLREMCHRAVTMKL
jgi:hypothetical protein